MTVRVSHVLCATQTRFAKDISVDDSGASEHITNNKDYLCNYKPLRTEEEIGIILGDGGQIKGIGTGSVMLGKLELQNVIYAPDMEVSVISTIALTRRGFIFIHQGAEGRIIDKNQEVLLKTKYNDDEGLFVVPYADTRGNGCQGVHSKAAIHNNEILRRIRQMAPPTRPHQPSTDENDGEFKVGGRAGMFNLSKTLHAKPAC